ADGDSDDAGCCFSSDATQSGVVDTPLSSTPPAPGLVKASTPRSSVATVLLKKLRVNFFFKNKHECLGLVEYGQTLRDPAMIRRRYCDGYFAQDSLSILPLYYRGEYFHTSASRVVRVLRTSHLLMLLNCLDEAVDMRAVWFVSIVRAPDTGTPSFASGNVFFSSVLDRIVCQIFYNPYITDLIDRPDDRHCRLFRIKVDANFVGGKFLDVFLELLRLDALSIGILRSPDPLLVNLLPLGSGADDFMGGTSRPFFDAMVTSRLTFMASRNTLLLDFQSCFFSGCSSAEAAAFLPPPAMPPLFPTPQPPSVALGDPLFSTKSDA
ncbi:hypothetical protein PybrP1_006042, partial [[Pythium] brassicae (nom. inval.)]